MKSARPGLMPFACASCVALKDGGAPKLGAACGAGEAPFAAPGGVIAPFGNCCNAAPGLPGACIPVVPDPIAPSCCMPGAGACTPVCCWAGGGNAPEPPLPRPPLPLPPPEPPGGGGVVPPPLPTLPPVGPK